MKKIIICNITMNDNLQKVAYEDYTGNSIFKKNVKYPINSLLENIIAKDDDVKLILLIKDEGIKDFEKNKEVFLNEFKANFTGDSSKITITPIVTSFTQERRVHEELMGKIVNEIEENSKIYCDITYGSKDLPIIVFTALSFAEKFLNCDIEGIYYGQVNFVDNKPVNGKLCDMSPLYYLNSITNTIKCDEPDKAREMLKSLLNI